MTMSQLASLPIVTRFLVSSVAFPPSTDDSRANTSGRSAEGLLLLSSDARLWLRFIGAQLLDQGYRRAGLIEGDLVHESPHQEQSMPELTTQRMR